MCPSFNKHAHIIQKLLGEVRNIVDVNNPEAYGSQYKSFFYVAGYIDDLGL